MFRLFNFYLKEKVKIFRKNQKFLNYEIHALFKKNLNPQIFSGIRKTAFISQTGQLIIWVSNPIFAQEIKNQKEELKEIINKNFQEDLIKEIVIKL